MKQFCCGEIVPGCQARFQGVDDDEIMNQVASHASSTHGLHNLPPELVVQVRAALAA